MIQTMFMTRLKIAAAVILSVGILGAGSGLLLHQAVKAQATASTTDQFLAAAPGQPAAVANQPVRKDAHGDPLPPGALLRLGSLHFRHAGPITYVAFPDKKSVITASQDGTIRLWDLDSGKEIRRYGKADGGARGAADPRQEALQALVAAQRQLRGGYYPQGTGSLALSPDGKTLAVPVNANTVQLYEVSTGKDIRQIKAANGVGVLAFSPDSKVLAGRANDRTVFLWEADSGKEIRQIKGKQAAPQQGGRIFVIGNVYGSSAGLVFSPDGKVLAMDESEIKDRKLNASVRLVEVETGKDIREIKIEQNGLSGIAFSPDGKILAYGSGTAIHLCSTDGAKEIRQIEGLEGGIAALVFAPDSKTLATKGMRDSTIRLCDVETGKVVRQLAEQADAGLGKLAAIRGFGGGSRDLAFSPNGKLVATGSGGPVLRLFEAATGKEQARSSGHRGPVSALVIAADGKTIVSKGADNTIRRWDAATGKELNHFTVPGGTTVVAFSPDAASVALGNIDNSIRVHETATGKEVYQAKGHANGIAAIAFSPDGKTMASRGSADNAIRLYDAVKGSDLKQITVQVENAAPNPGGGLVRAAFLGGNASLVFSPDGRTVASTVGGANAAQWQIIGAPGAGGPGNVIHLWDVTTGKVARKIGLPQQRSVTSMAFSPDGRVLATENADGTISLWEVASGKERMHLGKAGAAQPAAGRPALMIAGGGFGQFGGAAATTLAFAPDGRTLVARSGDQSIRVWDVVAGKEIRQFKGHQGGIATVAYAPNGKTVATGSDDTTILIWDVSNVSTAPKAQVAERSAKDVEGLWADLAGDDGVKAFRSMQKLMAGPKQVVPFLQGQLKAAPAVDAQKIVQWIANLESEKFAERKQALDELEKLGELAVPALNKVLTGQPPLETRKRVEQLLEKATGASLTTEQVRLVRSVEVLEEMGTAEARQLLETLAKGAPGALPTREAQAALDRLNKRSTSK
jgi:WD40 repeat protein